MQLIDGRAMARDLLNDIQAEIAELDFVPKFCDVLVGSDAASAQYVRMKEKRAREIGIEVHSAHFPGAISTDELLAEIKKINELPNMCGLIVQLPMPDHIDTEVILAAIDPRIDVDVLTPENEYAFYHGAPRFFYPTAAAVLAILDSLDEDFTHMQFVMVGHGRLVGRPVAQLLNDRGQAVIVVDETTENREQVIRSADVVISAVGKDNLITGDIISNGAIVIDAGTSEEGGNIVGDIDRQSVSQKARILSPVPGGVGPVTIAMLFRNVLLAAKAKR